MKRKFVFWVTIGFLLSYWGYTISTGPDSVTVTVTNEDNSEENEELNLSENDTQRQPGESSPNEERPDSPKEDEELPEEPKELPPNEEQPDSPKEDLPEEPKELPPDEEYPDLSPSEESPFLEDIPEDTVELSPVPPSFPQLGDITPGSYYPFAVSDDMQYLHINIFGRGWGVNQVPDTFLLQDDENKGEFPMGKWVSIANSGEYLVITEEYIIRYSPHFSTQYYAYTISDGAFAVTMVNMDIPT
jgi:hypothetical protein